LLRALPVKRPLHICLLTSAHPVDDVRLKEKLVSTFLSNGFRVTWVGPDHRYVPATAGARSGQVCEYALYPPPRSRIGRLFGRELARTAAHVKDVDIYFAPEPDSARAAVNLAQKRGAKVVFDIHELYHQSHIQNWGPRFTRPFTRWLVRRLIAKTCARCDLVIGVSEGVLAPYREAARDSVIVRNCAPVWFAGDVAVDEGSHNGDIFRIMHGKSTAYNGTSTLLRGVAGAMRRVRDVRVVVFEWFDREPVGAKNELTSQIETLGLQSAVELRAPVTMREMPSVLRTCDVGTIAHGRFLEAGTQPNRLYEYMAVGLPVLAPSYDKGIAPVVESERCGMVADFEDPESIADAIVYLRDNPDARHAMGRRGREAFLARHNWETEVRPLLSRLLSWFPERSTT
jgi:glycosyltransferase involved in cell wall biosynthesis